MLQKNYQQIHFCMPKINAEKYANELKNPYDSYWKFTNGKWRKIYNPTDIIKKWQQAVTKQLQDLFACPVYNFSGWHGLNNIKNAQIHAGANYFLTADISHFYEFTQAKWVKKFAVEKLHLTGNELSNFIKLTTFKNHLPTGASTSNILAFLVHQELFDVIYKAMKQQNIKFTLYVDDMTFSSNKPIPNNTVKYIKNVLQSHGLFLKSSKIKRFGFKGAHITGIRTTQSGKLQMPYKKGHEIVKILQEKPFEQMELKDVRGLIAKIGYIQQVYPKNSKKKAFQITKIKAIKQMKRLVEENSNKQKGNLNYV